MTHHVAIMFAAGLGIPVLAALNAALGRLIGSPAVAATILFAVAFVAAASVALFTGSGAAGRLQYAPLHLFFAGLFIAFYVLAITWIAPVMGVGNAVFLVLLGQLVSAALIDHFGLFGAEVTPVDFTRGAALALMATGIFLAQKA